MFSQRRYHGSLDNSTLTDFVCDKGCSESLQDWFSNVQQSCDGYKLFGFEPMTVGGRIWAGYNETCQKDLNTRRYCNDIIDEFTNVATINDMPHDEMCSFCHVQRLQMMQANPYSAYDDFYASTLDVVLSICGISGNTTLPPPVYTPDPTTPALCVSDNAYVTVAGDTCASIAQAHGVSSAALYMGNQELVPDCNNIKAGLTLCLPLLCETIYAVQPNDTCVRITMAHGDQLVYLSDLRKYNPWIDYSCTNLQAGSTIYGNIVCLSPQDGVYNHTTRAGYFPPQISGYAQFEEDPLANTTLATNTTLHCGVLHTAAERETCASICVQEQTTSDLFLAANPSLNATDCSGSLVPGLTYCAGPTRQFAQQS
ncbi:hypothetical protein VTN00DRAFT_3298 [Thermoascus crustaceus]|uniref:uncharacterized protein n=1 Tax=Thermoascus crustaceus TaxID=5088 RepID=UPI003743EE13